MKTEPTCPIHGEGAMQRGELHGPPDYTVAKEAWVCVAPAFEEYGPVGGGGRSGICGQVWEPEEEARGQEAKEGLQTDLDFADLTDSLGRPWDLDGFGPDD